LELRKTPPEIFRVARKPNPWEAPDWSRANIDGTFGNRFDDPHGYYRVLYAASQQVSCFVEALGRFRVDLTFLAELNEIEGPSDFAPLGEVSGDWCERRLIGRASATGNYADLYASGWVAFLRRKLAPECLRLGLRDLDAGILQREAPRRITQLASRQAYELGHAGIYYRSRYGHDFDNWALFEPFQIVPTNAIEIEMNNPALLEAVRILGLKLDPLR
jgi:hypothetical protein